jgi:hypothetical protein
VRGVRRGGFPISGSAVVRKERGAGEGGRGGGGGAGRGGGGGGGGGGERMASGRAAVVGGRRTIGRDFGSWTWVENTAIALLLACFVGA